MRFRLWSALLLVPFFLATTHAADKAQGPRMPDVPRLFGEFTPAKGVWAQYSVVDKAGGRESKMRMAIVDTEKESYWYEVWQEEGDSRNVIKMLVSGDPNEEKNIQRMIIKSGDGRATEMPMDFVVMGRQMATHQFEKRSGVPSSPEAAGIRVEEVGKRELTVPAGTYTTTQSRILDKDGKVLSTFDVSDKVPPFGIVLSETDQVSMKLLAHGTDAKTAITEEPVPMMTPPGMPEGVPRGMPPGMPTVK